MGNTLQIALIQTALAWENPAENRSNFEKRIRDIQSDIDMVLLPEMFASGFSMEPWQVAEPMDGDTVKWMRALAQETGFYLGGSLAIKDGGNYYNRLILMSPDGKIQTYDKRHTFTLAGEDKVYTAGNKRVLMEVKGWQLACLVCYDLRFPVWSRNDVDYDALIYVANWPKPRISAWDALLKARAIENMSYCIGVNRTGFDENNHEYPGHSAAYDGLGNPICFLDDKATTEIVTLDRDHLKAIRSKLKFLDDMDQFSLEV